MDLSQNKIIKIEKISSENKDEVNKCIKIKLITTNDNMNAIRFYQKRGFDMVHLYYDSVAASRKLKPSIPMVGDFGIPIKHEIEFEMKLI